jgi:hypothetical protein
MSRPDTPTSTKATPVRAAAAVAPWIFTAWALVSVVVALTSAPQWLALVIATPFAALGAGIAAVMVLPEVSGLPRAALALGVGLSVLILTSQLLTMLGVSFNDGAFALVLSIATISLAVLWGGIRSARARDTARANPNAKTHADPRERR